MKILIAILFCSMSALAQSETWIGNGTTNNPAVKIITVTSNQFLNVWYFNTSFSFYTNESGYYEDYKQDTSVSISNAVTNWTATYFDAGTSNRFYGPLIMTLKTSNSCLLSYDISTKYTPPSPNTGVVIPADVSGPVNIVLESSTDMINWAPSMPGIYGASATNRFFRVRALNQTQ